MHTYQSTPQVIGETGGVERMNPAVALHKQCWVTSRTSSGDGMSRFDLETERRRIEIANAPHARVAQVELDPNDRGGPGTAWCEHLHVILCSKCGAKLVGYDARAGGRFYLDGWVVHGWTVVLHRGARQRQPRSRHDQNALFSEACPHGVRRPGPRSIAVRAWNWKWASWTVDPLLDRDDARWRRLNLPVLWRCPCCRTLSSLDHVPHDEVQYT